MGYRRRRWETARQPGGIPLRCAPTRKTSFRTQAAAERRAAELEHLAVMRAYPCAYCGGWHLTSQADRTSTTTTSEEQR